ncbi:MAG: hypothetical protein Q9204_004369 [Flavoplaca sp. TL-2023a]
MVMIRLSLIILLPGAVALLLAYRFFGLHPSRRKLAAAHGWKPAKNYPHWDIFLGLDAIYQTIQAAKSHTYLARQRDLHKKFGTTFSSRFYLSSVINTIEPQNIQAVLSSNFVQYGIGNRRKNAFAPLLGQLGRSHSVFQLDGKPWKQSRAEVKPWFVRNHEADLRMLEKHFQTLLKCIPTDGKSTVDLGPLFLAFTAQVTVHMIFGCAAEDLGQSPPRMKEFLSAIHDAQRGCEERWQLGQVADWLPSSNFQASVTTVKGMMQDMIKTLLDCTQSTTKLPGAEVAGNQGQSFLRSLAERSSSLDAANEQLLTLFMAGVDTTAAHLTSLFHTLASRPEVWASLRAEVAFLQLGVEDGTQRPKPPTLAQLRSLNYVHGCVNECHRLYPVQPSNSRVANRDTILPTGGGADGKSPVFIAENTMVSYSITALHRRQDIWGADADEFRPERWNRDDEVGSLDSQDGKTTDGKAGLATRTKWSFIPFSAGPRTCLGIEMATIEIAYVVVRLVQYVKAVNSRDDAEWTEGLAMACTSRNGAKVSIKLDEDFNKTDK